MKLWRIGMGIHTSRCPDKEFSNQPSSASFHRFEIFVLQVPIFLSAEPDTILVPSGEKATDLTPSSLPASGSPTCFPLSASQILTALSDEPDTILVPSGEMATEQTVP